MISGLFRTYIHFLPSMPEMIHLPTPLFDRPAAPANSYCLSPRCFPRNCGRKIIRQHIPTERLSRRPHQSRIVPHRQRHLPTCTRSYIDAVASAFAGILWSVIPYRWTATKASSRRCRCGILIHHRMHRPSPATTGGSSSSLGHLNTNTQADSRPNKHVCL